MSEEYFYKAGIFTTVSLAIGSLIATAKALAGIKPRLIRVESDVGELKKEKLNKETFKAVKDHIDTKFENQGEWLKSVDGKLDTLIERRSNERSDGTG